MKSAAVIAEFNPFHNGHKYLSEQANRFGISHKVAVMSGSFVQRGDLSIISKFERAEFALSNGFDLIVELPISFALSSAQNFAFGGTQIADSLNVDYLLFGSENGETAKLTETAKTLLSDNIKPIIKENLKKGFTYAKALELAVKKINPDTIDLQNPNDILGIEYISSVLKNNFSVLPIAISRRAVKHDDELTNGNFASASLIRDYIKSGKTEDIKNFVPENIYSEYLRLYKNGEIADITSLEKAILIKIKSLSAADFKNISDVSEGLENKIVSAAKTSLTLQELLENIKSKRYTMSRIRRIILSAFLGIDNTFSKIDVPYIRVLGFNEKGLEIIKNAKNNIPIITKASQLKDNPLFIKEMFATDCFNTALRSPKCSSEDLTHKIIKRQ